MAGEPGPLLDTGKFWIVQKVVCSEMEIPKGKETERA